jgi:hypothetical protein
MTHGIISSSSNEALRLLPSVIDGSQRSAEAGTRGRMAGP